MIFPENRRNVTPRIVFLDRSTLNAELGRPRTPHIWAEYPTTPESEVVERLQGAQVAVVNKVRLPREALSRLPELRMIAIAATGTDNIDLDACRARGIVVSNIRNYANSSVPEHVFCMVLALMRNLFSFRSSVRSWPQSQRFCLPIHKIRDIRDSTFGIVGYGALGRTVADLASAFGARVLIAERKGAETCRAGYTAFHAVLEECDILSLHCPLNEETRNLIGQEELEKMKPDAILINTARGGLVDENALVHALENGLIGGAGFDVLRNEPPEPGNPLFEIDLPNFILTPHIAWTSDHALASLASQLIGNIDAFLRGEPENRV